MKNGETLDTTMGHHCAAASRQTELQGLSIGKCVQIYRAPLLYLPGAPNSLNPPLPTCHKVFYDFSYKTTCFSSTFNPE